MLLRSQNPQLLFWNLHLRDSDVFRSEGVLLHMADDGLDLLDLLGNCCLDHADHLLDRVQIRDLVDAARGVDGDVDDLVDQVQEIGETPSLPSSLDNLDKCGEGVDMTGEHRTSGDEDRSPPLHLASSHRLLQHIVDLAHHLVDGGDDDHQLLVLLLQAGRGGLALGDEGRRLVLQLLATTEGGLAGKPSSGHLPIELQNWKRQ